jgi:tetratricopeptide (TPR) repeat protein
MRHLDDTHQRKLRRLAVHRRSFKRDALERLCGSNDEATQLRSILTTRFLLNFYRGALALNPIVREISLSHLRDEPAEFRQAHSAAADYYLRHFRAKQMVGTHGRLGEYFAELRYHLVQAGRLAELREIGHRFTDHLKHEINSANPVPGDREELDERIAVLTVLLENEGAKGLEYHLARCLQARARPGDLEEAALHAERAVGAGAPESIWYLLASLKLRAEGADAAIAVIYRGLSLLDSDAAAPLYQLGGNILAGSGKTGDAVALLKDGIEVISPNNLVSLYQSCGELLAKTGKSDEAVALLKRGIEIVPPDKNLFSLYQILGAVLCRASKPSHAIAAQREGLARIPEQFGGYKLAEGAMYLCAGIGDATTLAGILSATGRDQLGRRTAALGRLLQLQMQGNWHGAADAAGAARVEFPTYFALAFIESFSRLAAGDADAGWKALANFTNLTLSVGSPTCWLAAFIHLRRGARSEATAALQQYLGRPVDESCELSEAFLLRLWDQRDASLESASLCFHFPIMPASLTGLSYPVRRAPFADAVLPAHSAPSAGGSPLPKPPVLRATTPEIYVSYAWGEDSTPEGRRREKIVDGLCEAVRASGREIGRDKERLRGGDSIERFAQEISKAERIVAVVSAKSLQSDFCMAHELFRAYRRCDFQRSEFQEKVIALVMDDAKPFLKDHLSVLSLADDWNDKFKKLKEKLHGIDPNRRNHDLWVFVDLVEAMVERLPGMLDALRDIVMKRGFDEIVEDGFQEVINRLPTEGRR